jgi:hypothetical protein
MTDNCTASSPACPKELMIPQTSECRREVRSLRYSLSSPSRPQKAVTDQWNRVSVTTQALERLHIPPSGCAVEFILCSAQLVRPFSSNEVSRLMYERPPEEGKDTVLEARGIVSGFIVQFGWSRVSSCRLRYWNGRHSYLGDIEAFLLRVFCHSTRKDTDEQGGNPERHAVQWVGNLWDGDCWRMIG